MLSFSANTMNRLANLSRTYRSPCKISRCFSTTSSGNEFIVKSPSPDVPEVVGATITEYVRSLVGNWGKLPAFECGLSGLKLTHDDAWKASRGFAAALLKARDLKRGDTVGVILPNHPFYAPILYGIWDAGLIASTFNPAYTPDEIARQLIDSNSKWVVTIPAFLPAIREAKRTNPNIKGIVLLGPPESDCHSFTEMIKTDPKGADFMRGDKINTKDQVALLPYSSGTTGLPKGVMLTHANLATHLRMIMAPGVLKFTNTNNNPKENAERLIGLLPIFHCYGLTNFVFMNMAGGAFTMTLPKFEPPSFLEAIRKHKPTIVHLVPPLIHLIGNSPDYGVKEFEPVHTVVGGAAPIGKLMVEKMFSKADKYIFFQEAYGMTEMSPGSHTLRETSKNTKIGSCGLPIPNTLSKIIATDGSGKILGPNQRGEVCVKGPQIMKGYLNNEEATRNTIDAEGWIHTGDIGYYDDDQHFYIVDRLKELIKVKGFQVAPAELEELLRSHPDIADAAVIGINSPEAGELPRAYIVKKDPNNTALTDEKIHAFINQKVTNHKQLKGGIEVISVIPKATSGKILRRELKKAYCEKHGIKM